MKPTGGIILIVLALAIIGISQSVFTVDQREQAIVLQLGQPVGDIKGPGLHFKLPVVQDVRYFDRRLLSVDPPPQQMVISSSRDNPLVSGADADFAAALEEAATPEAPVDENGNRGRTAVSGEPIMINTFARYRITDPLEFMKTLQTIPAATQRLEGIINDATRGVLGTSTLRELLSEERSRVMRDILDRVTTVINDDQLGIEIVDIRIVRADLTQELRISTVRRMISELQERATETRAMGEEKALEIRSTAEKEREIILAEGQRDAQILRGQGDQEAIQIYTSAFNKDREFYSFLRSMEAYRNALSDPDTRLILSPDSPFFKYMQNEGGAR